MKRKSICPICNQIFDVLSRNQACCCKEHQKSWRKMQESTRKRCKITPDDLDWCNAMLEFALDEITRLKSENAYLKIEKICSVQEKNTQIDQKNIEDISESMPIITKGNGKYIKECENCLQKFRTTDYRDKFCCERCRTEYAQGI